MSARYRPSKPTLEEWLFYVVGIPDRSIIIEFDEPQESIMTEDAEYEIIEKPQLLLPAPKNENEEKLP